MSDWYMGQLARQDPDWPEPQPAPALTPHEIAARRVQDQYRRLPPAGSSNMGAIADMLVPTEPWEYGLMAAGPGAGLVGRGLAQLPKAARVGALALGIGTTATEAEAGKAKLAKGLTGFAPGSAADVSQYANPRLHAAAEALRGKYPQYANEYPPVGPPDLIAKPPDPDKPGAFLATGGKPVPYASMEEALAKDAEPGFYLGKKKLPEVEQFQKDRAAIQKDMDLHGYDRYFDPAKRSDVDPKHYGPFDDTGTAAAPKTAAKDIEWSAKYGTPENRAKLQEGYAKGQTIKDATDWYFMGQLEKEYIKELGPKAGREAFKREFGDMMAATTGGANPYDNFLMSQYANVMTKRGERLPERSYDMPFPIGGQYASGNIAQARKYIEAGQKGFDPAVNPKRYDFSSAFQGNKNAATIDEQMYGALRPKGAPASEGLPTWYGPATRVAREEAQRAGVDPRGFQDVTWAGLKSGKVEAKGQKFDYEGPMIEHINRSIETTSRLTGMSPAEVVKRGLIRKEIPMYGLVGAGAMGALARQDEYRQ